LMSFLYGILFISLTGKFLLYMGSDDDESCIRRRSRGGGSIFLLGGGLFVIGSIGYFFGQLIKCAVCRQRECLADAAAVQFTRNPQALASALKKVGGLVYGSRILGAEADEASHMFFSDVMPDSFLGLMSTHPPLEWRVRQLDPSFNGQFEHIKSIPAQKREAGEVPPPIKNIMDVPNISAMAPATVVQIAALLNDNREQARENAKRKITVHHLTYAAGLNASFPQDLAAAARETFGACGLVYAMLLLPDNDARTKQIADVQPVAEGALLNAAQTYFSSVGMMSNGQKLALINVALPALRQMSALQYDSFAKTVKLLVESDSEISLFEYSLQKILLRHLEARYKQARPALVQYYAAAGVAPECAVLLSALAYQGSENNAEIVAAFQCGADQLDLPTGKEVSLLAAEDCNLAQIDSAITKITQAAMPVKKQILNACAYVIASDSLVKEEEAEMLRAIADAIACPLPPFVSAIGIAEAA
jgi:hypothetical protein